MRTYFVRTIGLVLFAVLLLAQCTSERDSSAAGDSSMQISPSDEFKVMTFNLRYDNPDDGENKWSNRKTFASDVIRNSGASMIGIQEGLHHQVVGLDSLLPDFTYVGVGRDDGATKGEYTAIFVDTTRLEVIEESTFWLSETPDRPSVGWDASMERIATYALVMPRQKGQGTMQRTMQGTVQRTMAFGNRPLLVVNGHFDHRGKTSRTEAARLIQDKVEELRQFGAMEAVPVIVMGDFNASPSSEAMGVFSSFLTDAYHGATTSPEGPVATYNAFEVIDGGYQDPEGRIDYVFLSDEFAVNSYAAIDEIRDGRYVSDHFPILVGLSVQKQ
ncbi:MAG: endonuclease/exonuclease/phosphatase family protein [Balneolaceae bacterium]|nr:endonuclease/exonuclease/phosphatase family protein [Balneolaceae bacterium]